jgi:DNA-binding IclR family transcriptional regulator
MSEKPDASGARKARIHKIHNMIQKEGEMDLKMLIANIAYQTGLTEIRVKQYLQILIHLDLVEFDNVLNIVRIKK